MTSSGKNGLNIRTNASPKWDRTRDNLVVDKIAVSSLDENKPIVD